ncbi:MAG: molecular chaperone HtpG [Anaerolineaceae bacterium]|nr:molecular chaperone HtpG [Anaerolineaceae bacterium]
MTEQIHGNPPLSQPITFKAETRQLLNILIHSLYTEREIFLRELISNSSDALTRLAFEMLTNRNVHDPEVEPAIRIYADEENNTLTIVDTGIGMTMAELDENLGTIARSGARAFIESAKQIEGSKFTDVIGQFGVGFYSAFMAADWIRVTSRSYQPDARAATWYSSGEETYTIEPADKATRGTEVIVHLREDAKEFTQKQRLREVIKKHSDFIAYPIYIGDESEQVNQPSAIWRKNPRQIEEKEYNEFYKQYSLDFKDPLAYAHMSIDAPVQMYALLFIPNSPEKNIFSSRKEDGLKLYARKILIQEYNRDLLPEYFRFIQGVVDSEDLPLNISRESIQSNRVIAQLKKLVTTKVIETLNKLGQDKPDTYTKFWSEFSGFIKQGIATEEENQEGLYPLLRFHSSLYPDEWVSLDDYLKRMQPDQAAIYYLLGQDDHSAIHSPHLDVVRKHGYEVLLLTDPLDSFVLMRLTEYASKPLKNLAAANLDLPKIEAAKEDESAEAVPSSDFVSLRERFKQQLGERVAEVRFTDVLQAAPARLVDLEGAINPEVQRVYRLLNREFDAPKKVLELNPAHPILVKLNTLTADNPLNRVIIDQLYEDALLIEGLHPNPASMVEHIQVLIQAALK